jgi:hypothetical protein
MLNQAPDSAEVGGFSFLYAGSGRNLVNRDILAIAKPTQVRPRGSREVRILTRLVAIQPGPRPTADARQHARAGHAAPDSVLPPRRLQASSFNRRVEVSRRDRGPVVRPARYHVYRTDPMPP